MSTERLYHEGNATEKWHSPRGPPERAASASAPYWRVWLRGAGPRETPPNGLLQSARAPTRRSSGPGQSTTRSCSASRLRTRAPTTCSALRPGSWEKRKRREEAEGGGKRQLTHAFQSLHSEQPGVLLPPLLSLLLSPPPLLPPEETDWTLRALLPLKEIPS